MTDAINAKSEALDLRELSSKELDAVSGGSIKLGGLMGGGGPMGILNQIMQQMQQMQQGQQGG
jgi:hypothetical protein